MYKSIIFLLIAAFLSITPVFAEGALTDKQAKEMLAAHNKARKSLGVKPLKWDKKLAEYAEEWANYLKNENNGKLKHRPYQGEYKMKYNHGENLFMAGPLIKKGKGVKKEISPEKVVSAWLSEQKDYIPETGKCTNKNNCGHFRQVVWQKTKKIGCAMVYNILWVTAARLTMLDQPVDIWHML